jgi:hypothetical protein
MSPTLRLELAQVPPEKPGDGLALLSTPVEFMRYCDVCKRETRFFADHVCASGLVGQCSLCGDPKVAPFTRMHSDGWKWEVETT